MEMYGYSFQREEDLMHHGIKGMKWGVRRWQNADGTFNEAGKKRYFSEGSGENYHSVGGTARRALAKVYDVNERYYSKHGNQAMASANKAVKDKLLAKADAADKAKKEATESRKIAKVEKTVGKFESKLSKQNESTLAGREKTRAKLEKKGASEKLKDFDKGTQYVKAGQTRVKQAVDTYKSMRISAIKDSSVKKSSAYKQAVKEFNNISRSGIPLSTLAYAMEEAAKDV